MATAREKFQGVGMRSIGAQPDDIRSRVDGLTPLNETNFIVEQNPITDPWFDHYLNQLAVHAVGPGEVALITPLIAGLEAYYRQIGILAGEERILEVPHDRSTVQRSESPYGWPAGNPLHDLLVAAIDDRTDLHDNTGRQLEYVPNGPNGGILRFKNEPGFVHIPTFNDKGVRRDTQRAEIASLEQPPFPITNNKVALRENASKYGIQMFPGEIVHTVDQLKALVGKYSKADFPHGIWLKMAGGVGGETVLKIRDVSEQALEEAVATFRKNYLEAFKQGEFGRTGEADWPEGEISPNHEGLVVEIDAKNIGEVEFVGSNHFRTKADGTVETLGYFKQETTIEGEWRGSRKIHPDRDDLELQRLIDEQTDALGRYNITENGFYGIQGADFVVVRLASGERKVFTLELNTRLPISSYADFAGEKLALFAGRDPKDADWINKNAVMPNKITDFQNFIDQLPLDAAGQSILYTPERGYGVVPLAFKTIAGPNHEPIIAWEHCKLLLVGSVEQQDELEQQLLAAGVKF